MVKRRKVTTLIPPPDWNLLKTKESEEERVRAFRIADYYVHYEIADKSKCKAFHTWAAKHWDKDEHRRLKKLTDHHYVTFGKVCYISNKLGYMPKLFSERLEEEKVKWLELADAKIEEIQEEKPKEATKKPSIQDHMRDQVSPLCEKWDVHVDKIFRNDFNVTSFKPHNDIIAFGTVKGPQAKLIKDEYEGLLTEAQEIAVWKDAEIKEAYGHTTAKQRKALVAFYEKIITACETVINTQKSTRKSRKPKAVSKERVVAKLKYQLNDGELGLASINPIDAVGANEVWVYNTKTRKIGCYYAASEDPSKMLRSSITFKGTTMQGYDAEKSVQRTLRKPNEQIKPFSGRARTKFHKAYNELKTIETKMNGRFNDTTIILRAF